MACHVKGIVMLASLKCDEATSGKRERKATYHFVPVVEADLPHFDVAHLRDSQKVPVGLKQKLMVLLDRLELLQMVREQCAEENGQVLNEVLLSVVAVLVHVPEV
jgi:hypothetical protein